MKLAPSTLAAALLALILGSVVAHAAADPAAELQDLIGKIQTKVSTGATTEKSLADELKAFDALLDEHRGEQTDAVAKILLMKGVLYAQVLKENDQGIAILQRVKAEFPNTETAKSVDAIVTQFTAQAAANKIQKSLAPGGRFPDFDEKDLLGEPLSVAKFKHKIVLVDFWATWCGPCVGELPNVHKVYDQYHGDGFEIIGISLDQDKDRLTTFLKENKVTWPQYFDGLGWQNKLSTRYGVNSIPATYLLDGEGKIIAKDLRGDALADAVKKALAGK